MATIGAAKSLRLREPTEAFVVGFETRSLIKPKIAVEVNDVSACRRRLVGF